jgi:hypothetical protein
MSKFNIDYAYVIYNKSTNKYIATDANSGGYPYDTDLFSARLWAEKSHAESYITTMQTTHYEVRKVGIVD